jgi:hypothetical protein
MNKRQAKSLEAHFEHQHNNPPPPFNKEYGKSGDYCIYLRVVGEVYIEMEKEGYWDSHTPEQGREECRRRRVERLKALGIDPGKYGL